MRNFTWSEKSWPLKQAFNISRGSKTHADVLTVKIENNGCIGWAECVPYARYGETLASVKQIFEQIKTQVESGLNRQQLAQLLPAGAARNALDCALWDLSACEKKTPLSHQLKLRPKQSVISAQTVSLNTDKKMAQDAKKLANCPILKIKVGRDSCIDAVKTIHLNAPKAQLIIDANEAWSIESLQQQADQLQSLNVVLIEQPLPAEADDALLSYRSPIPLCADESFHDSADLTSVANKYQAINIKLDKSGGLTEALNIINKLESAQYNHLQVMLGCMVGSSLAMAPAFILNQYADFIDLDGPALLSKDHPNGFVFTEKNMTQPTPFLWGEG